MNEFISAIQAAALAPPTEIIADGKIHRFPSNGKRGDDSGWYVLYGDDLPAGAFGCWRSGINETWHADIGRPFTKYEEAAHRAKVEVMRQARAEEERQIHAEARARAAAIFDKGARGKCGTVCPWHDYLDAKGVKSYGLKLHEERLVVPMRDEKGVLHSLQFIYRNGKKKFMPGGEAKGCYYAFGGDPGKVGVLCVVEGYATGASVHEATGYPVAVAFCADNLEAVARTLRAKFPIARIIICADDDYKTEGNPGLTKATEAARSVGGLVAIPSFGPNRAEKATDFNDLAQFLGSEAVKACIDGAKPPDAAQGETRQMDTQNTDAEVVASLATLSPMEYDRQRKEKAEALGVKVATLDKQVSAARKNDCQEKGVGFDEVEPWPEAINPTELLSNISATVKRFVVCDDETAHAVALWAAMTWLMDVVNVAPLAVITAPEKRCGKSILLFLLGKISCRPLVASNISPAALFRSIDAWRPTLLIDEADAFMRENEELRGILNCGHTRDSAYIVRVVGDEHTPTKFNVWGAKAIAGIGHLAETLMDRSVTLVLRRKLPHEEVERLRYAEPDLWETLTAKLARFSEDYRESVRLSRPHLPQSLNDRAQDNWEPLLAIAEVAGGDWPEIARKAALKLSGEDSPSQSVGVELLADIQEVFELKKIDRISTAALIEALCSDEEKSWATYNRGRSISPKQVSKRLKEYGIISKTVRIGYETAKGYTLDQFKEAYSRYLTSPPSPSVTTSQPNTKAALSVTEEPKRYGNNNEKVTPKPAPVLDCDAVTAKMGDKWSVKI